MLREVQRTIGALSETTWDLFLDGMFEDPTELIGMVGERAPELLCTYRHLYTRAKQWPYSLGSYVDVMAQVTAMPLLVLPHPTSDGVFDTPLKPVKQVLVLTDHITRSEDLVRYGASLTPEGGRLILAHVEDDATFQRYAEVIGKLADVQTEQTIASIKDRLLQEARDYIASAQEALEGVDVVSEVRMGHRIMDVRALINEHEVDLVAFAVKDDEQLAMHGLAYPLAIELTDIPVLMV